MTAQLSLDESFEACRECASALDGYAGHPHCALCHRSWTNLDEAHCPACCAHYATVDEFNEHIRAMSRRDGRHR